ncbi:MAG TPA: hypothetical protein VGL91_18570 [Acidobacteriota bacterium]|jgi:hypothetical protein
MAVRNRRTGDEGLIEWITVSYQTLKFWGLILLLIVLGGGAFYGFRYFVERTEKAGDKGLTSELRPVRFVDIDGEVRVKLVNQSNWTAARRDKLLNVGDMISTGPGANCKIMYFDGTNVIVHEDTLYVVTESYLNPQTEAHSIKGEITSGEVHMNTPERTNKKSSVKLGTVEAEAELQGNTEARGRRDKNAGQSEFYVYAGGATVLNKQDKKIITLAANEHLAVSKSAGASEVAQLPASPEIIHPQDSDPLLVKQTPAQVELSWKPVSGIHQYRVRVSDQPTFSSARYNQVVKTTSVRLNNLGAGTYYWQLYSVADNGVESNARSSKFFLSSSEKKHFGTPIKLVVTKWVAMGDIFELIGMTEPGVRLTVNGKPAEVDANGQFKIFTDPLGNTATLTLVARDISGNITSTMVPVKSK